MRGIFLLTFFVAAALAAPQEQKPFVSIDFQEYWTRQRIYDYMNELVAARPDIAGVFQMGRSEGGIDIMGMQIVNLERLADHDLPIIFVTAGVNARDWISTMAAINLAHELVDHYDDYQNIVDNVEWFIVPVSNPDGYEFSMTEGNRAWVKNRRVNPGSDCLGVRIERNFEFNWGLPLFASNDPCADNYWGPAGDSEEETKTIQFANDIFRPWEAAYVTLKAGVVDGHTAITFPFSSSREIFRGQHHEQISVAHIMADAIQRETGVNYAVTSESNLVGLLSGTSADYASGVDTVPLAYSIYVPSGGENGWDVPVSSINDIVRQVFAGLNALADHVSTLPLP